MKTLLLSREDVQKSLTMEGVITSVEESYRAFASGKVKQPDIMSIDVPEYRSEMDIKSCYNADNESISIKIASGSFDNMKKLGLPNILGVLIILDGRSGAPVCIMDSSLITGIRTGAAGAISAKQLARKDSKVAAVFGGGNQARMQIYALCSVMPIDTVKVYSEYKDELQEYKADVERETKAEVIICNSPEQTMDGADIVISTTPSTNYFVEKSFVKPGMHIIAVGADMEGKNELDPEIFRDAKIVTDSTDQCLSRGETRNAVIAGMIDRDDIYAEIGQIVTGDKPGRENDSEITIFDTTGMGVQDNTTAMKVFEVANDKGLGNWFEFI